MALLDFLPLNLLSLDLLPLNLSLDPLSFDPDLLSFDLLSYLISLNTFSNLEHEGFTVYFCIFLTQECHI